MGSERSPTGSLITPCHSDSVAPPSTFHILETAASRCQRTSGSDQQAQDHTADTGMISCNAECLIRTADGSNTAFSGRLRQIWPFCITGILRISR